MGGIRYWNIQVELNEYGPTGIDPEIDIKEDWVDPIVGGRIYFDFSDKLKASLRGDVGGFGIGTASELTWMVSAIGEYKFNPNVGLVFGYRYLDLDWSQGSGTGLVAFDLTIHGPIIGIDIAF